MAFDSPRQNSFTPYNVRVVKNDNGSAHFSVTKKQDDGGYTEVSKSKNLSGYIKSISFYEKKSKKDNKEISYVDLLLLDPTEKQSLFVSMFNGMLSNDLINKLVGKDLNLPTNFWLANAQKKDASGNYVDVKTNDGKLISKFNIKPSLKTEEKVPFYGDVVYNDDKIEDESKKCNHPLKQEYLKMKELSIKAKSNVLVAEFLQKELLEPYLLSQGWTKESISDSNESSSKSGVRYTNKNHLFGEQNNEHAHAEDVDTHVDIPDTTETPSDDLPF